MSHLRSQMICDLPFQEFHTVTMNADYWEQRTALIRDGAVRVLSLSKPEEVDYWRDELKSNRRNSHEIELMTWGNHTSTLAGARITAVVTKSLSTSSSSFALQKENS
jgi:hypothetical protein